MADLMHCLTNSLFFDITLLYCDISFNSSIISCIFSGDMYLSFDACNKSLASLFCDGNFAEDFF